MDHPASLPRPHSWRTTAVVAAAVAAFELVLLLLIGLAFVGRAVGSEDGPVKALTTARQESAATSPSSPAKSQVAGPKLKRDETSVMVLNGNGRAGAAAETADLIRSRNYLIAGTGDAPRTDFARTIVMFRPEYRAEAVRLARDFRLKRVAPLDGLKLTDLQGAHIALVVGSK